MNGLPYYKAYPRDFMEGTIGMPFELKGAYRLVLDLIYMQAGSLPDDPKYVSAHLGCSVRAWNNFRSALIGLGKIEVEKGFISNFRASLEVDKLKIISDKQRENGAKGGKNNGLRQAAAKPKPSQPEPEPDKKEEISKLISCPPAFKTDACIAHFNGVAERIGWPQVQRLSPARKSALVHRITDCGGADHWCEAINRAALSPLLTGQNNRQWRADFDWLCKPANFTKLMEGNYDARLGNTDGAHQRRTGGAHDSMVAGFAFIANQQPHGQGSN